MTLMTAWKISTIVFVSFLVKNIELRVRHYDNLERCILSPSGYLFSPLQQVFMLSQANHVLAVALYLAYRH